ncbi:hypothetical protein ACHAXR_009846 [Thalassiosira sp. AJA248-18]
MEYDLVHQLKNPTSSNDNDGNNNNLRIQLSGCDTPRTTMEANLKQQVQVEEPRTPTTHTCDILSSLRLSLGSEGLDISLTGSSDLSGMSVVPITPASPMTPEEESVGSVNDTPTERSYSSPTAASTVASSSTIAKPNLVTKRNTCGTIYLGSTLSAPDKDALIKCVCGVYRAHLLQAESSSASSSSSNYYNSAPPMIYNHGQKTSNNSNDDNTTHQIFHDRRAPGDYRHLDTTSIPTLSAITDFYRSIFLRSQMEVDCIIISLIYIERLIKVTAGNLSPHPTNWRSILFSCMVLASKVWDDLSMWNCDFSKIGPSGMTFSLARTNELEVALLRALGYRVKVNASEYAKYYFLLRGMLCRSGLANDDLTSRWSRPLDVKGAMTLNEENKKVGGGGMMMMGKVLMKERSKSYGHWEDTIKGGGSGEDTVGSSGGGGGGSGSGSAVVTMPPPQSSPASKRASLEQIVRM